MNNYKPEIRRTRRSFIGVMAVFFMLLISGCGDFFETKHTEIQSNNIIRDLGRVPEITDTKIALPDIYLTGPKIIEAKDGVNLFYFTRYHTVEKYSGLIKEQFGYIISQNPATNQLIVKCPTPEDAQKVLLFLQQVDVPPIQIKIDCLVSEIYADRTLDWETTLQISDLLGEDITLGGSAKAFGIDVAELIKDTIPLPAFPGASLREIARARMGLKIGYLSERHNFLAMVDLLESRGYMKILMHPTLEVINGRKAKILSSESVPVPKEVTKTGGGQVYPYMLTEYKDVIDSLEIIPHAFADGSIGLETKVVIGSKNIPEGVKQIPILTRREIDIEENRIRPGESLIIGGLRKSFERSVVRGVPLLKDIPAVGALFSSKDYEEQAKEVLFIITPSISSGGIPNNQMINILREENRLPNISHQLNQTPKIPSSLNPGQTPQNPQKDDFNWLRKYVDEKK